MYDVIIENEVQIQLKELKDLLIQEQGEKKGSKTFKKLLSDIDNLQFFETGNNILETYFVDCPDNWYVMYSTKNYFIFSRTEYTVTILKMYNERQDFIFDLFGVEMRSNESKRFWGE